MGSSDNRLVLDLVKDLKRTSGWRVEDSRGKHITVYPPDGGKIIGLPRTPSDHRWRKNARSQLRAGGWTGTLLD